MGAYCKSQKVLFPKTNWEKLAHFHNKRYIQHMEKILLRYLTIYLCFFGLSASAQTTYDFDFAVENVYATPIPNPVGGVYPPTDYQSVVEPLFTESHANNYAIGVSSQDVSASALPRDPVIFGGSTPGGAGYGFTPLSLFVNTLHDEADFPVVVTAEFYSRSLDFAYNESYIVLMPETYTHYGSPAYFFGATEVPREGIVVGYAPGRTRIVNHGSASEAPDVLSDVTHNAFSTGAWYTLSVLFELINGQLVVSYVGINDECVVSEPVVVGQIDWLSSFRVGLSIDDMAHGLTYITQYQPPTPTINAPALVCAGACIELTATEAGGSEACEGDPTYNWNFVGAEPATADGPGPVEVCYATPGTYTIELEVTEGGSTQVLTQDISVEAVVVPDLGPDTLLCAGDELTLDPMSPGAIGYTWQDGSVDPTYLATGPGTYSVTAAYACGSFADTLEIEQAEPPTVALPVDTVLCNGATYTVQLNADPQIAYQWQDGSTGASYTISTAGTYGVTATNACGTVTDSVTVTTQSSNILLDLGNDTLLCSASSFDLDAFHPDVATYLWQDGSNAPTYEVFAAGFYAVTVSNACETLSDTIQVVLAPETSFGYPLDTLLLCVGDTFLLDVDQPGTGNYTWQDGSTGPQYAVSGPGTLVVQADSDCGSLTDTVEAVLTEYPPLTFALGPDTLLCTGDTLVLSAFDAAAESYAWQDGSSADSLVVTTPGLYVVMVSNYCETRTDSLVVSGPAPLTYSLEPDNLSRCPGETLVLSATDSAALSYRWQDGSTDSTFLVTNSGEYTVVVSNGCTADTQSVEVRTVPELVTPDFGGPLSLCADEFITLDALTLGATDYLWSDSSTDARLRVDTAGLYSVVVANACQSVRAEALVRADRCCELWVPNAISPNRDGLNDVLDVYLPAAGCANIEVFELHVFDRWGEHLFESTDRFVRWDGTFRGQNMPPGVYVWTLRYEDAGEVYRQQGSVTLLR